MSFHSKTTFMYMSSDSDPSATERITGETAMFVRSTRFNQVLSLLFVLTMGACGNLGGCGACGAAKPLPAGGLPTNQTVEGGAQIRVTPAGFSKLTSILPGALNTQLANGFCVGQGQIGSFGFLGTGARWCNTNNNGCNPGCKANVALNSGGLTLAVTNQQTLNIAISASISSTIHIEGQLLGIGLGSCNLGVSSNNLSANVDIAFGIKAADGELDIHAANLNALQLNLDFSGCGIVSQIANLATSILDAFDTLLAPFLTPIVDNLLQGFIPSPLGIAGMMDVGKLLASVSPGTKAEMEARLVPGGYVALNANGMSLGVITGLNSDIDPMTRTGMRPDGVPFASEPSLCVPPIPITDFATPPYSLPSVFRSAFSGNAFKLGAVAEFDGMPDPAADLAMGLSKTMLDLAGHHLVASGAMCLGVGTSYIKQLNVGTIGILVPSLGDLQSDAGNDPLLMVTRPQRAIDFTIGENTPASPALTIGLSHMEVDFYAFLYERYVRAFTLDLTMNIGVNLAFSQVAGMPAKITPTLVGISAASVTLKVLNSEFVKETPAHLEMVLPAVFDLVTPLLGNLPPITVPTFAGFSLNQLSIQHVHNAAIPGDDFLALYANLGSSPFLRLLGSKDAMAATAVKALDDALPAVQAQSTGHARLIGVVTPPAETVRAALLKTKGGALPTVTFDVDRYDSRGRELEWTWNFDGGMWREYSSASPLVISDRAFAWQGKYSIGLKSRVVGDYHTESDVIETPVVIDSVGPRIFVDKATWDGDRYVVPVFDVVSEKTVVVAYGRPGDDKPATDWVALADAPISLAAADKLAVDGQLQMFAKDELGNQTIALVAPFHGQAGATGCGCASNSRPGVGSLALIGLVGFGLRRRRLAASRLTRLRRAAFDLLGRRRLPRWVMSLGLWLGASVAVSLQPGCSCHNAAKSCETVADCGRDSCPKGQLPFCIDNTCVCSDDIPVGRIGPYSSVATGPGGEIWVAAYAQTHGDLVVSHPNPGRVPDDWWEWVDGVPDGPVVAPNSHIRGGIADDGPDVGMYTSIKVAPDGTPMVTYFDRTSASLKFAMRTGPATWETSIIEFGDGALEGGIRTGMYTSLTLRADDGRPGVAYLAHYTNANGQYAEVRYAAAQTAHPKGASDWQFWTVDTGSIPPPDPAKPNIYPLPEGLGLFVDSTRDPRNQAPVVAYYDRMTGDLKMSKFNATTGQFAAPIVLAGLSGIDAGWSPSVQVDMAGVAHVAYVDASSDNLMYITEGKKAEVVDDGYRIVGQTVDGLPKPTFDFVGDDAGLIMAPGIGPLVVYQDSTTQELLLASKSAAGMWTHTSIAGATDPWPGAYGFFASAAVGGTDLVMSTWVIDQPTNDNWVEVFSRPITSF